MLKMEEYVDIKNYSTLKVGGQFRYFTRITSVSDLPLIYAIAYDDGKYKDLPIIILGGGSNILFSDGIINVIALKVEMKGFEILNNTSEFIDIKVGAGENWDQIVEKTVEMNLSGLECLSAIPGTVGASPVQNIGAYGSEVKDTILEVEVYDLKNNIISILTNADCHFSYRDSIFKNEAKGKYLITRVTYRLQKQNHKQVPSRVSHSGLSNVNESNLAHATEGTVCDFASRALSYPGVVKYFVDKKIQNPTIKEIRQAIIDIRRDKLPNPSEIPNVGSFFKNPIVSNDRASSVKLLYPEAKFFSVDDSHIKIPAGWLIEKAGLKGKSFGKVAVYDKNALVLVNNGNATHEDIIKARNDVIDIVKVKFGITLEQEPEIV